MLGGGNVYKYLKMCANGFWSCEKILTFGRPWNFVTGSRSVGKSTGVAIFFALDFIVNGHKFVYTRRTKDETLLTCHTFFGNAAHIISTCTPFNVKCIRYEKQSYKITYEKNGEEVTDECGIVIPLSLEQKYKSANFSDFFNLVYDEFIAQESTRYLGTKETPEREYKAVISLYQTIDRGIGKAYRNETRFFFLGNTATIYNPIFLSLNISEYIQEDSRFIRPKGKLWILEQVKTVEALSTIEHSFAYQLSDQETRDYAYRNKGSDSNEYVRKLPEQRLYICTLALKGNNYGVWREVNGSDYYIGKPMEHGYIISLDLKSHNTNDLKMITKWQEFPMINILLKSFKNSGLFFVNGKVKSVFIKYFELMP